MNIDFEELHVFDNSISKYVPREMYEKAEALAASRLELLRRYEWAGDYQGIPVCPECGGARDYGGHAEDCELAEELGDDK